MMISVVTIDIGNSRTKLAKFDVDGNLIEYQEDAKLTEELLEDQGRVIYSTVVSEIPEILQNAVAFGVGLCTDLQILVQQKETLGKDRLAAVMGAKRLFPNKNCLVIDAGTCITYDYLLENGDYLGGAISMGMLMRYRSLNAFTSKLPSLENEKMPDDLSDIGKFTSEAIHSGVLMGFFDEVGSRIDRFKNKYGDCTVILTGGDADFLAKHIKNEIFVEPLLVHYGLYHAIQTA